MINKQIPISFIDKRCKLSWQEVVWGYERQLLGWKDIINLAQSLVDGGSSDSTIMELSHLNKEKVWHVSELMKKIAASEHTERDENIRRKWLYVTLAWLFEKRIDLDDPLGEVETVYADFDYPLEIQGFVRYMPVKGDYDPLLHSSKENERRLFDIWQNYLDKTGEELGCIKNDGQRA